jgi:hypothetical protein
LYFRAVNILPNRFIGVVGEHDGFPIENMCVSHDKTLLASCSHDQKIKFWNVQNVKKEKIDQTRRAKRGNKTKPLNTSAANSNFFADLEEKHDDKGADNDDSDSDDDNDVDSDGVSDSDDEEGEKVEANGNNDVHSGSDSDDDDDDDEEEAEDGA